VEPTGARRDLGHLALTEAIMSTNQVGNRAYFHKPYEDLPVTTMYTLPQLAAAANMSRGRLLRLLDALGVERVRVGRIWLVPLSELACKARPLYLSIERAEALRKLPDLR
jgi:hypothetical protein